MTQAHYELIQDGTNESLVYGSLAAVKQVERRLLWRLFTPTPGHQLYADPTKYAKPGEPPFLGIYEVSRSEIRTVIYEWTKPRNWQLLQELIGCQLYRVIDDKLVELPRNPDWQDWVIDDELAKPFPGSPEEFMAELPDYLADPQAYNRSGIRQWLFSGDPQFNVNYADWLDDHPEEKPRGYDW
ncbi:hypothetical protein [Lacticaseibacillus sp. GG6-2]